MSIKGLVINRSRKTEIQIHVEPNIYILFIKDAYFQQYTCFKDTPI